MNTTNSKKTNLVSTPPPGTSPLTVTLSDFLQGALIRPSTQRSTTPLSPIVDAQFSQDGRNIIVYAVILIDANVSINSNNLDFFESPVIQNPDGTIVKSLYAAYDYYEEIPEALVPYSFNFEIPAESRLGTINSIELYLWDEDPVGSRGTKTTVKPPTQ